MTKKFEDTVISLLSSMDTRMDGMQQDISGMKSDVSKLKIDVSGLKSDVDELKTGHQSHERKLDMLLDIAATQNQLLEDHSRRHDSHDKLFRQIIDGLAPGMVTTTEHESRLKDHEFRISALEAA